MAQVVKNPPAMQEHGKCGFNQEDPVEEGMATHSNTLVWRILMDRGAWQTTVHRVAESDLTEHA